MVHGLGHQQVSRSERKDGRTIVAESVRIAQDTRPAPLDTIEIDDGAPPDGADRNAGRVARGHAASERQPECEVDGAIGIGSKTGAGIPGASLGSDAVIRRALLS